MIGIKGKIKEKPGPGFKKLYDELGGLGTITLGVQGKEAAEQHSKSELAVGSVAAIHELGLGVRKRSWLVSWLNQNEARMRTEARAAMAQVASGKLGRKRALQGLGMKWVTGLRDNIDSGGISPPLAPSTVKRKGHAIPLLETGDVRDAITYRLFLPRLKNVPGGSAQSAAKMSMGSGEVKSPQPPKRGKTAPGLSSLAKKARAVNGLGGKKRVRVKQVKFSRGRKAPKVKKAHYSAVARMRQRFLRAEARRGSARMKLLQGLQAGGRGVSFKRSGRGHPSILKFLYRMVKKALRSTRQSGGYRNHGFTGVRGRSGRTGRAGFR